MWEAIQASFIRAPWGWGLLASFVGAFLVFYPKVKKLQIDEHSQMRKEYVDEIKALRAEVAQLREQNVSLLRELTDVKVELVGYKKQHLAEQAAAIRHVPGVREAVQDVAREIYRG